MDKLFRDDSAVEDLDAPLDIVRYEGKLYSLRNRRATVFSMVQGTRRDKLVNVPCRLFDLKYLFNYLCCIVYIYMYMYIYVSKTW